MTHVGTSLTAKGVKPIVNYQQNFKNTYLYGAYSPINGNHFTWEVQGVDTLVFEAYLKEFSIYKHEELKIVIIDTCEKVWQYLKERFKNQTFRNIENLKDWLHQTVRNEITNDKVISIVKSDFYINTFKDCFNS